MDRGRDQQIPALSREVSEMTSQDPTGARAVARPETQSLSDIQCSGSGPDSGSVDVLADLCLDTLFGRPIICPAHRVSHLSPPTECDVCRIWRMPHPSGCQRPTPIKLYRDEPVPDLTDDDFVLQLSTDGEYVDVDLSDVDEI